MLQIKMHLSYSPVPLTSHHFHLLCFMFQSVCEQIGHQRNSTSIKKKRHAEQKTTRQEETKVSVTTTLSIHEKETVIATSMKGTFRDSKAIQIKITTMALTTEVTKSCDRNGRSHPSLVIQKRCRLTLFGMVELYVMRLLTMVLCNVDVIIFVSFFFSITGKTGEAEYTDA